MAYSQKRAEEISKLVKEVGKDEAARRLNLTHSSLSSAIRRARSFGPEIKKRDFNPTGFLKRIGEIYTDSELQAIANGGRILPGIENVPIISFEGQRIRIGAITDSHIGHLKFSEDRLFQAFEEFRKEKVDFITHSGDVVDGMSNHAGQIYELSHIGYEQQKDYAVKLFSQWTDSEIYAISGNHDRWYIKSNGANIVKDISIQCPNFHFIGHDEGDISLKGITTLKLWHGEDSSSYALSYRLQKIVESLTGGEKPGLLLCGHTHKYVKIFERNIHTMSVGCLEAQTSWMRGKRLAAAVGFSIIDVWLGTKGITKITETWHPFYT